MLLKKQIRNLAYLFLNLLPKQKGASILMYHSVGDSSILFNVLPTDFKKQMDYLYKHKYRVIKLKNLIEKIKNKEKIEAKTVALTFDDGYKENYGSAFSVLKKYNFPATIFLVSSYMGAKFNGLEVLNWQEIREMKNSGLIDFGFHSHTHPRNIDNLDKEKFLEEINKSKEILKEINPVMVFAYPRGKFTDKQVSILKQNNFVAGLTVEPGKNNINSDVFLLKRNFVHKDCGMQEFKNKL